jgi:hypothetical protein
LSAASTEASDWLATGPGPQVAFSTWIASMHWPYVCPRILALRGMVFTRDGGEFVHAMEWGPVGKPAELGAYLAGVLLRKGARDLIEGIPH